MAIENPAMFKKKYIFDWWMFSITMLVFRGYSLWNSKPPKFYAEEFRMGCGKSMFILRSKDK